MKRKTRKRTIDPVNDPVYNIMGMIKQSILLEEHICLEKKYCKDCITKHFLHIIGLAEEAVLLAGKKKYALLRESVDFYNKLFLEWIKHTMDNRVIGEQLRTRRKMLVHKYLLKG